MSAKLKKEIEDLQKLITSIQADQSIFYTEVLKIALVNDYIEIKDYLNPTPEEENEAWNQIDKERSDDE